jgi:hypothetical protein
VPRRAPARYVVVVLDPTRAEEALGVGVVVGIPVERDRGAAGEAALAVQAGLRSAFPDRRGLAVVLTNDEDGTVEPGATLVPGDATRPAPAIHIGAPGPATAFHTLLDVAVAAGAPACALLEPMPRPPGAGWLRALFDPVLRNEADLVAPSYSRGRYDGVLVTGLVYPLTRALFGQRLRQPLGQEIVLGRRLAEQLSRDDAWRSDPAHAGTHLWVVTMALVRECRFAQVFLGPRPVPQPQPPDVSDALAAVLGTLFHEMDLHASRWQRVRSSCPVGTFGEEHPEGGPGPAPAAGSLVDAFALGLQDLRRLWSPVLPPQALYALQRISREPASAFRIPDPLWARVVYDFAVGWRVKAMERQQLLRSMTPLYLGWVASYVNEVAALERPEVDARIERLAAAFEAEKPYLISRWRWPDRFSP